MNRNEQKVSKLTKRMFYLLSKEMISSQSVRIVYTRLTKMFCWELCTYFEEYIKKKKNNN